MRIEAKGALKFGSEAKATVALETYAANGYGVNSTDDWTSGGAYTFIDTTLELDADMVGYESVFDGMAQAAQEGELELRADGTSLFIRLTRAKGKKRVERKTLIAGFGDALSARKRAWGAAVETAREKVKRDRGKAEAARAASGALAAKLLVASVPLGRAAFGLTRDRDALAGGQFVRVGPAGEIVQSTRVAPPESFELTSFVRLDAETVAFWADGGDELKILVREELRAVSLAPAKTAPAGNTRARVAEVFPSSRPGELIVREAFSLRRLARDTLETLGEVPLGEVVAHEIPYLQERPSRAVCKRGSTAVRLPDGVAFAANRETGSTIAVFDDLLTERFTVTLPSAKKVRSLLVRDGELLAMVGAMYEQGAVVPVGAQGLGAPILELSSAGPCVLLAGDGLAVTQGNEAVLWISGRKSTVRPPMSAVAIPSDDGRRVAFADLKYGGHVKAIVDGAPAFDADAGTTLSGLIWVGEGLIGWGHGATLYWLRAGEAKATPLTGHPGSIRACVALDATRFVSLDESGELRTWDLSR